MYPLRRHSLAHADPAAWRCLLESQLYVHAEPLLWEWANRGYPLIVRRANDRDAGAGIPLGLPLPPAHGKKRIAFVMAAESIREVHLPPLLAEAGQSAPLCWRDTIRRLVSVDPEVRVYGSLAWQHVTGLTYLNEASDLDLLWRHRYPRELETLLHAVHVIEREAPMRIDGELVASSGAAVHWREIFLGTREVLAKRMEGVRLVARADFLHRAP